MKVTTYSALLALLMTSGLVHAQLPAPFGVESNGPVTVRPAVATADTDTADATPGEPPSIRDNGDGTSTVFTRNAVVTGERVETTAGGVVLETNGDVTLSSEVTSTTPFEYNIYSQFTVDNATNTPISPTTYVAGTEDGGVITELPLVTVVRPNPLDPTTWSIDLADPNLDFEDIAGAPVDETANGDLTVEGLTTTNGINNSGEQINGVADGVADDDAATVGQVNAGDAALGDRIDDEIVDRTAVDATLTTNLANEVTARTNADTTLTTNLANEVTARTNADATLTTNLANEVTARTNADATLTTNLANEVTARTNADTAIRGEFAAADAALGSAVRSEFAAADTVERNARTAADTAIRGEFATADTALGGRIDSEISARIAGDNTVRTEFAAADTLIRTQFAAADTLIRSDFTSADTAIRGEFAAADTTERNARIAGDSRLQSNIDENTRGIAMVAAMTNTTVDIGKTHGVDFNMAQFQSETGFAFGYANRINENVQVHTSVASTTDFDESVVRLGVAVQW
jgi:hypothetical protein